MSYTLIPYCIDLNELRRAMGSKDETLVAAVAAREPESFDSADDDDEGLSLREALRQLVMGQPTDAESAYQYGYALKHVCQHLGESLPSDCWESIGWQVLEATGMEQLLAETGPPVAMPRSSDFPIIGHLTAEQVAAVVAKLEKTPLKSAALSGSKPRWSLRSWLLKLLMSRISQRGPLRDEDVRELLDEYEGWLREAASKNRGLVFFYH